MAKSRLSCFCEQLRFWGLPKLFGNTFGSSWLFQWTLYPRSADRHISHRDSSLFRPKISNSNPGRWGLISRSKTQIWQHIVTDIVPLGVYRPAMGRQIPRVPRNQFTIRSNRQPASWPASPSSPEEPPGRPGSALLDPSSVVVRHPRDPQKILHRHHCG